MAESLDIQITRLQEQMKTLFKVMEEDREIRRESDKQLTQIAASMMLIDGRIAVVENQLAAHGPTIAEFTAVKHQVKGGGRMAVWAWASAVTVINLIYTSREYIMRLFVN